MTDSNTQEMIETLEEAYQHVYDPEFPLIDIWTMGLFYGITPKPETKTIHILMTFTTPTCPAGDQIEEMVRTATHDEYPDWEIDLQITFDPLWTTDMMKDEDLKKLFS